MSSASQRQARIQIRRATEALNALAERDDQGAVLAAQLAGLVAVLAETATDGAQFNAGLITALAAGSVGSKVAGESDMAKAAEAAEAPREGRVAPASGQDEAVGDQRRRLNAMTVPQLRKLITEQRIPHPQISALSKAKKAALIETIVAARASGPASDDSVSAGVPLAAQPDEVPPATSAATPIHPVSTDMSLATGSATSTHPVSTDAPPTTGSATPTHPVSADAPPAGQQAGGKRKRMPSVLDPYAVARQEGETALRARLANLDVDQLKDLVHDYGMDYDHRAMRWTDQQRLIGRIIDRVDFGTTQGSAFRDAALPENP